MRSTELNWDVSDCVLGVFGKLWTRRDAWTCSAKVLEY
jgi:hypothetical protein